MDLVYHAVVPVEDMNRVEVLLNMLDGCVNDDHIDNPSTIETAFVYCTVWAMGSTLTISDDGTDYRKLFSDYWRDETCFPRGKRYLIIGWIPDQIHSILGPSLLSSTRSAMTAAACP